MLQTIVAILALLIIVAISGMVGFAVGVTKGRKKASQEAAAALPGAGGFAPNPQANQQSAGGWE